MRPNQRHPHPTEEAAEVVPTVSATTAPCTTPAVPPSDPRAAPDGRPELARHFCQRNGRLFIAGTSGAFSSDELGAQMLDFQHFVLRRSLGDIHQAPLLAPAWIMDLGCSTGRWMTEMATKYPDAHVVGVDLVPPRGIESLLRPLGARAANVHYVAGDILDGLPFPDEVFDYVYMRLMYSEIPAARYMAVIAEMARVTRMGGWIECMETAAIPYDPSPAYGTVMAWSVEVCQRQGLDADIGTQLRGLFAAVGVARIHERICVPSREQTPQHLRRMLLAQMRAALDYWRDPVLAAGITDAQAYATVAAAARLELEQDTHVNGDVLHIVWGQRVPPAR